MPWLLLLVPLALIAALVLLPLRLWVRAQSDPPRLRVALRPMGPLVPWIPVVDTDRSGHARKSRSRRDTRAEKRPRGRDARLSSRRLRALIEALGAVRHAISLDHARLCARVGLGDPADTGRLFGFLTPVLYAWPERVRVQPDFSGPVIEGTLSLCVGIRPVRLVAPGLRLAVAWRRL